MKNRKLNNWYLAKKKKNQENTSKADGINLDPSSNEYRERVRDLKGIDELEQEDIKLSERKTKVLDDVRPSKKEKEFYQVKVEKEPEIRELERVNRDKMRLSSTQRAVSHQILKAGQTAVLEKIATREAAKTEDTLDDKFVKRQLPKELLKDIYDEGKSLDDFYPGSSVLDKYM